MEYPLIKAWFLAMDQIIQIIGKDKEFLHLTRDMLLDLEFEEEKKEPLGTAKFMWSGGTQSSAYAYHLVDKEQTPTTDDRYYALCGMHFYTVTDARTDDVDYGQSWVDVVSDVPPPDVYKRYLCAHCKKAS